jgi:hypothetical protein
MRKALILLFLVISIAGNSQAFKGFFKPVPSNLLVGSDLMRYKADGLNVTVSKWVMRPAVTLSALQISKSTTPGKQVDVSSLTKAGMGLSYSHFVQQNGTPYNDFSVNAIFLFDVVPAGTTSINLSPVLTLSALQFVSVGVGYDIGANKAFGLIGINYNFSQ